MPSKPVFRLVPAALAALCLAVPSASARPRLLPGPLTGTALTLGGLAGAGIGIAILKARACRTDPACATAKASRRPGDPPPPEPGRPRP